MSRTLLIAVLCAIGMSVQAQDVRIEMDERIEEELRMKNASVDTTAIAGYRIQIHFGSDMQEADASMSMCMAKFPELRDQIYKLYQQPYWKIRVGNFYREIDAQAQLKEIRAQFPDAFVVGDQIDTPPVPDTDMDDPVEPDENEAED